MPISLVQVTEFGIDHRVTDITDFAASATVTYVIFQGNNCFPPFTTPFFALPTFNKIKALDSNVSVNLPVMFQCQAIHSRAHCNRICGIGWQTSRWLHIQLHVGPGAFPASIYSDLIPPIAGEHDKDFNFNINGPNIDIGPIIDMDQPLCKNFKFSDSTTTPPEINEEHDPNDSPIYEEFEPKDPMIIDGKHKQQLSQRARAAAGEDDEWATNTIKDIYNLKEVMAITIGSEQCTVPEARCTLDWPQWKEAMDYEIKALRSCNTWNIVDDPNMPGLISDSDMAMPDQKAPLDIIGSKWVFHHKWDAQGNISNYRAHLVAQGFTQVDGVDYFQDETFTSIHRILTKSVHRCYH